MEWRYSKAKMRFQSLLCRRQSIYSARRQPRLVEPTIASNNCDCRTGLVKQSAKPNCAMLTPTGGADWAIQLGAFRGEAAAEQAPQVKF
jgi:hypothetical protein